MSFFSGSAKTSVHMLQEIKVACVFLGGGIKSRRVRSNMLLN